MGLEEKAGELLSLFFVPSGCMASFVHHHIF